jgi:hypothetical protein
MTDSFERSLATEPTESVTTVFKAPATARLGGPGSLRILGAGAASLVLAVSAAVALAGSAPAETDSQPVAGAVGPGPADAEGFVGLAAALAADGAADQGEPDKGAAGQAANRAGRPGRIGGPALREITISARSGSTLSLKTADGWTRQITVTSETTITRAGAAISVGELNVGDRIAFRQARNDDGTYRILEIRVIVPHVAGEVTAAAGSSLTIKLRDGSSRTITVNGSTKYFLGPRAATQSDVKVGSHIVVAGTTAGDTFTALSVTIRLQALAGEVIAKSADTITVRGRDDATTTVRVDAATTYRVAGKADATLADVTVGMRIVVTGSRTGDTTFAAVTVGAGRIPNADRGPGRMRIPGLPGRSATPAPTSSTAPTNAS